MKLWFTLLVAGACSLMASDNRLVADDDLDAVVRAQQPRDNREIAELRAAAVVQVTQLAEQRQPVYIPMTFDSLLHR